MRKEEEERLTFKETEVQSAAAPYEDGSMQSMVRGTTAAELTKARVYVLAEYAESK